MKSLRLLCVAFGALMAVASSSAAVKPQTINLLEIDTSVTATGGFNLQGNAPPSVGQGIVIQGDSYKWNGKKRGAHVGTLHVVCTFTSIDLIKHTGTNLCNAVASLPAGQIVVTGISPQSNTFDLAIVGGTGAYTGAKGYVRIKNIGGGNSNKSSNTIVITG